MRKLEEGLATMLLLQESLLSEYHMHGLSSVLAAQVIGRISDTGEDAILANVDEITYPRTLTWNQHNVDWTDFLDCLLRNVLPLSPNLITCSIHTMSCKCNNNRTILGA